LKKVEAVVSVAVQHLIEAAGEHKGDVWKTPTNVLPERYAVETGMTTSLNTTSKRSGSLSINFSASSALEASTVW
jgi:hypothetical protein